MREASEWSMLQATNRARVHAPGAKAIKTLAASLYVYSSCNIVTMTRTRKPSIDMSQPVIYHSFSLRSVVES